MSCVNNILSLIGNTPLLNLNKIGEGAIFAKAEFLNPGGSIKDRVANYIIDEAVKSGSLRKGMTIVEATSGNTGIAVAFVGALRGYNVIICMPEDMSEERKKIIRVFGATLIETPKEKSIAGSVEKLNEILAELGDNAFTVGQFVNELNPKIHYLTTGREIWSQMDGRVDAFVAGVGSGGTLTGVGRYIKEKNPNAKIIAVEPKNSAALLGHEPGFHQIQGIGDGFIPQILDVNLIDEVITVTDDDAIKMTRQLASIEGTLVGTSSGANVWASVHIASRLGDGCRIATVMPDRAERYFSTSLL